jgi:hypothetical protein
MVELVAVVATGGFLDAGELVRVGGLGGAPLRLRSVFVFLVGVGTFSLVFDTAGRGGVVLPVVGGDFLDAEELL